MEKIEKTFDKKYLNLFNKTNFVFAIVFACFPFIVFILNRFTVYNIFMLFMIWYSIFIVFFIIFSPQYLKSFREQISKSKIIKWVYILLFTFLFFVVLSAIINNSFGNNFLTIFGFLILFLCVASLDKKHIKIFLNVLISFIIFSFIINIIDPYQSWILYLNNGYPMSSFFSNPNYSSFIACMFIIVLVNLFLFKRDIKQKIIYSICFVISSIFIYMNGSFASITAVYLFLILELVVLWIKNKKLPLILLLSILSFIAICLLLELIPNFHDVCTCKYNYFIECVAVFDNIFHTNLLQIIFNIGGVQGSDGWDRESLVKNTLFYVTGGEESTFFGKLRIIFFGCGSGSTQVYRPHNMFISIWLEFGIVASLLQYAIITLLVIYVFKNSKAYLSSIRPFIYATFAYLFVTIFGSLIVYHYIYFISIIAIMTKIAFANKNITLENIEKV